MYNNDDSCEGGIVVKNVDRNKSMKLKGMTLLLSLTLGSVNLGGCVNNKKDINKKSSSAVTMSQVDKDYINESYNRSDYLANLLLVNDSINDYLDSNNLQKEEKECNGVLYNDFKARCHDDEELDRAITKVDGYSDCEEVDFENEYFFRKLFVLLDDGEFDDYLKSLTKDQIYALAVYVHRNIYHNGLKLNYENLYRKILSNVMNVEYSKFEDSDSNLLYIESDKKYLQYFEEQYWVSNLARHHGISIEEASLLCKLIKKMPEGNFMVRDMAKSEYFGDEDNIEKLYKDLYESLGTFNIALNEYGKQKRKIKK